MKRITMLLAAFGLMLAGYTLASACVCDLPLKRVSLKKAVAKAKSEAAVVFSGQVIELDDSIVKLRVERLWKGVPAEEIVLINTGMGKAPSGDRIISSCAYNFRMGEKYLVYAFGSGGKLQTHKCTRTAVLEGAAEDFKTLENLAPKKKAKPLVLSEAKPNARHAPDPPSACMGSSGWVMPGVRRLRIERAGIIISLRLITHEKNYAHTSPVSSRMRARVRHSLPCAR